MRTLKFWQDKTEVFTDDGSEWPFAERLQWFCSDGISTYFGDTKAQAAAHFGVPVGDFDDVKSAAAILGRKGGSVKSEKKTAAVRENARKPRRSAWQNWVAGDAPENCIPLGNQEADEHGLPEGVRVVRARSAEEACKKGNQGIQQNRKEGMK